MAKYLLEKTLRHCDGRICWKSALWDTGEVSIGRCNALKVASELLKGRLGVTIREKMPCGWNSTVKLPEGVLGNCWPQGLLDAVQVLEKLLVLQEGVLVRPWVWQDSPKRDTPEPGEEPLLLQCTFSTIK